MLVALAAEAPLQVRRLHPRAALGLVAEVALEVGLERPPRRQPARALELDAVERRVERLAAPPGSDAGVRRAEPVASFSRRSVVSSTACAREPRRIALGIRRHALGREQRLDQPAHAAGGERLELARALGAPLGELGQHRRADRRGQRRRVGLVARLRLGALELARRRRLARRPGHLGQQPPAALLPQLVGEQRAHVVEERRGHERLALLVRRPPGQEQHLLGARDAGVEQRALAVEHVLVERQPQPRRHAQRPPRLVVEERLGHGPLGELAVLEPAHEHGAEAARADVERVGEQDALGRRRPGAPRRRRARRAAPPRRRAAPGRARAARPRRSAAPAATRASSRSSAVSTSARRACGAAQVASASATSASSSASGPAAAAAASASSRGSAHGARFAGRLAGAGDLVRAAPAPRARRRRRPRRRCGHPERPQPRQQVLGAPARQRRPRARQHAGAEPRPRQRHPPRPRDRDAVGAEHLREQRRRPRPAHEHRDVLRRHAVAHQLEHLGADDLGLRALAARLEQPHRAVRRARLGAGLEQPALEMVQRRPRGAA